jgi:type I restriction enzyme S subunit
LRAFNQVVSPLFESIKNNEESRQVLSSLRDEILPRLISGKLRIEEAEEAVAEVLPQVTSQEQAA